MAVRGHPRSLILVPIESAYATSIVLRGNLGPTLHRFEDIAGFVLMTSPSSTLILGGVHVGPDRPYWDQFEHEP